MGPGPGPAGGCRAIMAMNAIVRRTGSLSATVTRTVTARNRRAVRLRVGVSAQAVSLACIFGGGLGGPWFVS